MRCGDWGGPGESGGRSRMGMEPTEPPRVERDARRLGPTYELGRRGNRAGRGPTGRNPVKPLQRALVRGEGRRPAVSRGWGGGVCGRSHAGLPGRRSGEGRRRRRRARGGEYSVPKGGGKGSNAAPGRGPVRAHDRRRLSCGIDGQRLGFPPASGTWMRNPTAAAGFGDALPIGGDRPPIVCPGTECSSSVCRAFSSPLPDPYRSEDEEAPPGSCPVTISAAATFCAR